MTQSGGVNSRLVIPAMNTEKDPYRIERVQALFQCGLSFKNDEL